MESLLSVPKETTRPLSHCSSFSFSFFFFLFRVAVVGFHTHTDCFTEWFLVFFTRRLRLTPSLSCERTSRGHKASHLHATFLHVVTLHDVKGSCWICCIMSPRLPVLWWRKAFITLRRLMVPGENTCSPADGRVMILHTDMLLIVITACTKCGLIHRRK